MNWNYFLININFHQWVWLDTEHQKQSSYCYVISFQTRSINTIIEELEGHRCLATATAVVNSRGTAIIPHDESKPTLGDRQPRIVQHSPTTGRPPSRTHAESFMRDYHESMWWPLTINQVPGTQNCRDVTLEWTTTTDDPSSYLSAN